MTIHTSPGILASSVRTTMDLIASPFEGACDTLLAPQEVCVGISRRIGRGLNKKIKTKVPYHSMPHSPASKANAIRKRNVRRWETKGKFIGTVAAIALAPASLIYGGVKGLIKGIIKTPVQFMNHYSGRHMEKEIIYEELKFRKHCILNPVRT